MITTEICHFCNKDYTNDNITYLLEGPAKEVNICEKCVERAHSLIDHRSKLLVSYHRCNVCGSSKESWHYGCSPFVCFDCLKTMNHLISLAKRIEYAL